MNFKSMAYKERRVSNEPSPARVLSKAFCELFDIFDFVGPPPPLRTSLLYVLLYSTCAVFFISDIGFLLPSTQRTHAHTRTRTLSALLSGDSLGRRPQSPGYSHPEIRASAPCPSSVADI